jgi:TBC1 domain family protein 5
MYNKYLMENKKPNKFPKILDKYEKVSGKSKDTYSSIEILKEIIEKKTDIKELINKGIDDKIPYDFRSIMWKIFFNILQIGEFEKWSESIQKSRENYYKKCKDYYAEDFLDFINSKESNNANKMNEIYSNKILEYFLIIKIDIDRTFQEIELFNKKEIKQSLCRILYIWCVENQDLGYVQGMNEILGTLFYSLYPSNAMRKFEEKETSYFSSYFFNSEKHFESDMYEIYSEMLTRDLKELYSYNLEKYKEIHGILDGFESKDKLSLSPYDIYSTTHSPLKKRINKIFYLYLKIIDKELFYHLHDKVEPYLFLFRWILCLLNREINLKDIIQVWDWIFAIECLDFTNKKSDVYIWHFNFLDYICVSMICMQKDKLLQDDDPCYLLSQLMHYTDEININKILNSALNIRNSIHDYLEISNKYDP